MATKQPDESVFYVGVRDPIMMRKSLLESTKDIVVNLKRYEKFMAVREEKKQNQDKLKGIVKEITKLISQLRKELPETGLREEKKAAKNVKFKKLKNAKKEEPKKPKEMSELEKLESELGHIENKLSGLA